MILTAEKEHCEWGDSGCFGPGHCKCRCCEPAIVLGKGPGDLWTVTFEYVTPTACKTSFTVGVQSFELAYADTNDDTEAEQHCRFIGRMFVQALGKIGVQSVVRLAEVQQAEG